MTTNRQVDTRGLAARFGRPTTPPAPGPPEPARGRKRRTTLDVPEELYGDWRRAMRDREETLGRDDVGAEHLRALMTLYLSNETVRAATDQLVARGGMRARR